MSTIDGRTTYDSNTALALRASRGKNCIKNYVDRKKSSSHIIKVSIALYIKDSLRMSLKCTVRHTQKQKSADVTGKQGQIMQRYFHFLHFQ